MIYTTVMNIPVEKEKGILLGRLQSGFNYLGNALVLSWIPYCKIGKNKSSSQSGCEDYLK